MSTKTLCKHCGHEWETRSLRPYTTCPTCLYKVRVRPATSGTPQPKLPALEDLRRMLRDQMPALEEQYGVRSLAVFGSYVRGEQTRASDLDLLVELGDKRISLLDFVGMEQRLSDVLGIKVDLVETRGLRPAIGRRILAEAVPL